MNGIILIDKEMNYTSHDVVAKLRGIFHQKKIGHTGTLDPQATGLLPVCLGNATKVCDILTDKEKEYLATIRFGIVTDTQDIYGTVQKAVHSEITRQQFVHVLNAMVGKQEQLTPMYSARKINGKKLCDLARQGIEIDRKTKQIEIYEVELIQFSEEAQEAVFRVLCSAGTYVRTLCYDMGQLLGCGACMSALRRTRTGPFSLEDAKTISEVETLFTKDPEFPWMIRIDSLFSELPKAYVSSEEGRRFLLNGNPLKKEHLSCLPSGKFLVYNQEKFTGIYKKESENLAYPVKMFL